MALELKQVEQDGNGIVEARGEIDLYSSPQLREAILKVCKSTKQKVGVNLSEVTYMDSSGVATLVEGLQAAGGANSFVLVAPSQPVLKVLQLSRLDSVFTIVEQL
jgi:anti-sigma B factor antagonist